MVSEVSRGRFRVLAKIPDRYRRLPSSPRWRLALGLLRRQSKPLVDRPGRQQACAASGHEPAKSIKPPPAVHGEVRHRSSLRTSWLLLPPCAAVRGRARWYAAVSCCSTHRLDDLLNCKVHIMRVPSASVRVHET